MSLRRATTFVFPALLLACLSSAAQVSGNSGVLIPKDQQAPDPKVLSLEEMSIDVDIEDGDARVFLTQIFLNHTNGIQEGTYNFALPHGATVSDFAVWDGAVRIPAVVLERRRATEVYEQARLQAIDPGLLQMGERTEANTAQTSLFSAKIVPIPAYATKRLELEYHQRLDATNFLESFLLSLKPDADGQQSVHTFHVHLTLHSAAAVTDLKVGDGFPFKITQQDAHSLEAVADATNFSLTHDLTASWKLDPAGSDTLSVLTHRDPRTPLPSPADTARTPAAPEPGFFEATLLVGAGPAPATAAAAAPRNVVILFDNSLSMQWEKLERSYAAAETLLRQLRPPDTFNVVLFNQRVVGFQPQPVPADAAHVQQALDFIRASKLRGGTDLGLALTQGLAQSTAPNTLLVLLTDGGSDRGESVLPRTIAANYTKQWKALPHPPHTDVFAVGDDANLGLLKLLAANGGVLEQVLSTEPVEPRFNTFLSKITCDPISGLALSLAPPTSTHFVYPLDASVYGGSTASWIGQYTAAATAQPVDFTANGLRDGAAFTAHTRADLPVESLAHPQLPRLWAQARVDALLDQISRDGESRDAIEEIIKLARRYKLVTPYTSFLAVPRSLLRPRVIRPGDPVLRVRTDPAIQSVVAIFPFGLTKPLRHLASEDTPDRTTTGGRLWETRFLAPTDMKDGTYSVRLILRDSGGNTYREEKTFVIASTPPTVKVALPTKLLHRGQAMLIHASASSTTRTLTARLPGAAPVALRWSSAASANTGEIYIPADLPLGNYTLTVTAEDVAHNIGSEEVPVEIVP